MANLRCRSSEKEGESSRSLPEFSTCVRSWEMVRRSSDVSGARGAREVNCDVRMHGSHRELT
jgi:hypothetical protein